MEREMLVVVAMAVKFRGKEIPIVMCQMLLAYKWVPIEAWLVRRANGDVNRYAAHSECFFFGGRIRTESSNKMCIIRSMVKLFFKPLKKNLENEKFIAAAKNPSIHPKVRCSPPSRISTTSSIFVDAKRRRRKEYKNLLKKNF